MSEPEPVSSPLAEALARVGDRWTLLIVDALLPGPRRFNDLLGQIPGIAANILSERLKRLEREALLVARPYSDRPPRAAYELTAEGKELAGALRLLAHWGARRTDPAETPRHGECGTPVEVALVLPHLRPPRRRRVPRLPAPGIALRIVPCQPVFARLPGWSWVILASRWGLASDVPTSGGAGHGQPKDPRVPP